MCFKWRMADRCPGPDTEKLGLRCMYKHHKSRNVHKYEHAIEPENVQEIAVMKSPGYKENKEKPSYLNNNFCIYNISLSCSDGETVQLIGRNSTGFNDNLDYLWFSEQLMRSGQHNVYRDSIVNFRDEINAHSFIAVFWTSYKNDKGKFQIEARCSGEPIPVSQVEPLPLMTN